MDGRWALRIENGAARGASALFAASVGYSAYALLTSLGLASPFGLAVAGAGALVYLPCNRLLSMVEKRGAHISLPAFEPTVYEPSDPVDELLLDERLEPGELLLTERVDPEELLLTQEDRVDAPLLLDDVLAEIAPDARVVRLFDRSTMQPTAALGASPAELQARIADHLGDGTPRFAPPNAPAPPDATEALSAALKELRRSLR